MKPTATSNRRRACNRPVSPFRGLRAPWTILFRPLVTNVAWSCGILGERVTHDLLDSLEEGKWARAVEIADSISKQSYGDFKQHFAWNQLAAMVRKVPFSDPLLKPTEAALETFRAAERRCKEVNRDWSPGPYHENLDVARAWIQRVIGVSPNLDLIYQNCDFGPGASIGHPSTKTNWARKLSSRKWTVSRLCAPYAVQGLLRNMQVYRHLSGNWEKEILCLDHEKVVDAIQERIEYVDYNNITVVPKTATTGRSIAVEPLLNTFVQKGIDQVLRFLLKRAGIDLRWQEKNCYLAKIGSVEGARGDSNPLCTIDLTSASDLISRKLVKYLLPPDWFDLLEATRSKSYSIQAGEPTRYEKFCSMGNGFCFPLETLIFASLAYSCGAASRPWAVYGDDIIVHRRAALQLVPLLESVGFSVNEKKTFLWGSFRESCGADYFGGENVRPFVLDFIPESYKEWIKMGNGLQNRTRDLSEVVLWITEAIDSKKRFVRPIDGPPEEAITVPLDLFMASRFAQWDRHIHGWRWTVSRSSPRRDTTQFHCSVEYAGLMRGARASEVGTPIFTLRQ